MTGVGLRHLGLTHTLLEVYESFGQCFFYRRFAEIPLWLLGPTAQKIFLHLRILSMDFLQQADRNQTLHLMPPLIPM